MAAIIYQYVIPNTLFFIVLFAIFLVTQALIVFFIRWMEYKNRERLMFLVLKSYKHYRKLRLAFRIAGIVLFAAAILVIASCLKSLTLRPEVTIFAVSMLLVITLVYFILANLKGDFSIKKTGDKIIYIILSLLLYAGILLAVNQKLPNYRVYVYRNMVNPVVAEITGMMEESEEQELLNEFRGMLLKGLCPYTDYEKEENPNIIHNLLYVATDPGLKTIDRPRIPFDNSAKIKGRECTNGKETFLLTGYGEWYWVIETYM